MIRHSSRQRPERLPEMPSPLPAWLMSWQGNPPQITSANPLGALSVVTSSKHGTPGQCFARTFLQKGSISQNAIVLNPPVRSSPSEKPPMPLNKSMTVSIHDFAPQPLPLPEIAKTQVEPSALLRRLSRR
jgi:hypothetical protein